MGGEIGEQRAVGDDDAVRKAGRAAGILQIGDVVRRRLMQRRIRRVLPGEALPVEAGDVACFGGGGGHGQLGRVEEQGGIGAVELHLELLDIGIAAAEGGGQRQRDRPGAGVERAEEQGDELRRRLGDQRDAVARLDAARDQSARARGGVRAQLGIGIDAHERRPRVMEVHAARAAGGIIERLGHRREIGAAARQSVIGRGRL